MNPCWHIQLLSELRLQSETQTITRFRTHKTGVLLAYLAYHDDRLHAREVLTTLLWPEATPKAGQNSLRVALASLRRQLEPPGIVSGAVLKADRFSVGLNAEAVTTDVRDMETALASVRQARSIQERIQHLETAVEAYRGELLPGYYEEWVLPEQRRLAGLFMQATRELVQALEARREWERALHFAQRAVSLAPDEAEGHRMVLRLQQWRGRSDQTATPSERDNQPQFATMQNRFSVPSFDLHSLSRTVTLLCADIEGGETISETEEVSRETLFARYREALESCCLRHGGEIVSAAGESLVAAFGRVSEALACAVESYRALSQKGTPDTLIPLRMALTTGEVERQEIHSVLQPALRVLTAGYGGQILCAEECAALLRGHLPEDVRLVDLGVYRMRDIPAPKRLFQVTLPWMSLDTFPPLKAEAGYPLHLPQTFTRFFGREEEIQRLTAMLGEGATNLGEQARFRLVTLTGAGGSGKTRLVLEAAKRLAPVFEGAVWFVSLSGLSGASWIADATLQAMRVPRTPHRDLMQQVIEALSARPGLLALDNFEHLVEEGALVVRTLLERVPGLTCLITSRQLLGLEGEREFPVLPLPFPLENKTPEGLLDYASVQLFVDRAQAVRPDFQVTPLNAPTVAELVRRLEGIPLALELAASRAQVLTPGQMLQGLQHRFDFLVSPWRDTVARHRTLRAAVEWSYRLLTPELQRFFARLSVFRGGWTLEAAEVVCEQSQALSSLAFLVSSSLAMAEETEQGMRYRMLETMREYGWEQLGEERATLQERHLHHYLHLVEGTYTRWFEPPEDPTATRLLLEAELDNLRTALETCVAAGERGAEWGLRLSAAMQWFWAYTGRMTEGRMHFAAALSQPGAEARTQLRARALMWAGWLSLSHGDHVGVQSLFEECVLIGREIGDKELSAWPLGGQFCVAFHQGEYLRALTLLDDQRVALAELGDRLGIASELHFRAGVFVEMGDDQTACSLLEETLKEVRDFEQRGNAPPLITSVLGDLGNIRFRQGDYVAARTLQEESLLGRRKYVPRSVHLVKALMNLGMTVLYQGDTLKARSLFEESLNLALDIGASDGMVFLQELICFAALAVREGETVRAARLLGASERLIQEMQYAFRRTLRLNYEKTADEARQSLSEEAFSSAWQEGRAMTQDQAVAYVLTSGEAAMD